MRETADGQFTAQHISAFTHAEQTERAGFARIRLGKSPAVIADSYHHAAAAAPHFNGDFVRAGMTRHIGQRLLHDAKNRGRGISAHAKILVGNIQRDANIGARMFLLNYAHQPANSPYRSTHAIYVQDGAANAAVAINTVPDMLRTRLLSIRAFDSDGMIVDADVVEGVEAASVFERLLQNDRAAYLHVHNAKRGCYAARVERVV